MIRSFRDRRTAPIFTGDSPRGMARDLGLPARRKLAVLDAAMGLADLRVPPGSTRSASTINGAWCSPGARMARMMPKSSPPTKPRAATRKPAASGSISRSELDAGRVAFAASAGVLPPVHPGEVLRHDFLAPLGLTAHALAMALRVPANRIAAILSGRRAVSADTALRLARHFGTGAGFWLNLQSAHDLEAANRRDGARIVLEVLPRDAAPQVEAGA